MQAAEADRLTAAAPVEVGTPPALVVRLGPPELATCSWRPWVGWSAAWPAQVQRDAVRGDWVTDADAALDSGRLAAFVVAAYPTDRIDEVVGPAGSGRTRCRFAVHEDPDVAEPFTGRRWQHPAGWTTAPLGRTDSSSPCRPARRSRRRSVEPGTPRQPAGPSPTPAGQA